MQLPMHALYRQPYSVGGSGIHMTLVSMTLCVYTPSDTQVLTQCIRKQRSYKAINSYTNQYSAVMYVHQSEGNLAWQGDKKDQ